MENILNFTQLIGNTPLVDLSRFANAVGLTENGCRLLGKLERQNPAGSVKDRVALQMLLDARDKGIINQNTTIIEPTSGNTGIGLAAAAAYFGYKMILTMPETMSIERQKLASAYGAQVILTDGKLGMKGAVDHAETLSKQIPDAFIPSQFKNPSNSKAHESTTGPEIWHDTDGKIDILIAGIGTGGTITGAGKFLKSQNSAIKIIGVEPDDSPLLSQGRSGPHKIQGIGANFIPELLDQKIYDSIIPISQKDAYDATRKLPRLEGLLVGISSGAALAAGIKIGLLNENKGKIIVVILPDTGERYLSTDVFD